LKQNGKAVTHKINFQMLRRWGNELISEGEKELKIMEIELVDMPILLMKKSFEATALFEALQI